jgi:hypothetical protein
LTPRAPWAHGNALALDAVARRARQNKVLHAVRRRARALIIHRTYHEALAGVTAPVVEGCE